MITKNIGREEQLSVVSNEGAADILTQALSGDDLEFSERIIDDYVNLLTSNLFLFSTKKEAIYYSFN